jgi:hypothetical protein
MSLAARVVAAKDEVEAKYAAQLANNIPLDPNQQAEILIAQVNAIFAGETLTLEQTETVIEADKEPSP